jgi:hypothetical protein
MTTLTRLLAAHAVCSDCRTNPATHLITTPAGASLVCAICRPIDLVPASGPADPAGASMTGVTR